jgi:Helicase conserved C-terminal domain/MrfA Zn-binding domain
VDAARGLRFLVLDELHTYRGRQGADVGLLCRRVREACHATELQCVGTSATLAGSGTIEEQREEVARLATLLFGAAVEPASVIGETLRRATAPARPDDAELREALARRVTSPPPDDVTAFLADPLASWIETTLGLEHEPETGRLRRARPRMIGGDDGAAAELAGLIGRNETVCADAIRATLMKGYDLRNPDNGFPVFAFRLHQLFTRGETVYATVEPEDTRFVTTQEQQFAPDDRSKILLPLAFCRECGQEYYTVRIVPGDAGTEIQPRRLNDTTGNDEDEETGFLYASADQPWPDEGEELLGRVPDDWLEGYQGGERVKRDFRKHLPKPISVRADGHVGDDGMRFHFAHTPFRFCLSCGVAHAGRQPKDFGKLMTLGAGGRSSATTILGLAAIRSLRSDESLDPVARKLLSFTDNRQDASLQAGHFNDFVEVGLIRSALFRAAEAAGDGLTHDELALRVFDALSLPIDQYAIDPAVRFGAREDTDRAFRDVLAYRIYRDLERGWRITAPNLEQCGLLEIGYGSLDEVCATEDVWEAKHATLATAAPERRANVAKVLLDLLRRELAIRVDYLRRDWQEALQQRSSQSLIEPWALDEDEELVHARVAYPRPRAGQDYRGDLYVGTRGMFGQFLRRPTTFGPHVRLSTADTETVIADIFDGLREAGLLIVVREGEEGASGYQVAASQLRWRAGDGTKPYHDPIRVPQLPEGGGKTNPFFVNFYRGVAADGQGLQAREHTAQVPSDEREKREKLFREAKLPVLFCSPTMELGVDIADLNVVNMRNIPPTPANYAQRSGRAGRSGQPALVFDYAAAGNSHDQYYFRRPTDMVSGQVKPPRLDLANEDLVRAHVQAVWLTTTGKSLGGSLADVLDLSDEDGRHFPVMSDLEEVFRDGALPARARPGAHALLGSIPMLDDAEWMHDGWLEEALREAPKAFDRACDRWRELYVGALDARDAQNRVANDFSRPAKERGIARQLRAQAEAQLELLRGNDQRSNLQSDFYSYRYFASEGFLPGYSFPRLPLSAFIPARRGRKGRDEFVQRPRFLAISEFGPRSIVYHEGARYVINRVFLPAERDEENRLPTNVVKQCSGCGYLHPVDPDDPGLDICESCGAPLDPPLTRLFRLQNVGTKRRDRINSDEEERVRQGFEVRTGVRFAEREGRGQRVADIVSAGAKWGTLTYGGAATLWRINVGWTRRKNKDVLGFVLDTQNGYWATNPEAAADDREDAMSNSRERVVPYVEDRRNALLFQPSRPLPANVMASLAAALKSATQVTYDLEDSELAAEPLPNRDFRNLLLFYEAAEGGAGVLRQLASDPTALPRVAAEALRLCHFDPETGADFGSAPGARERCAAACYDCLLSYSNQWDHRQLDRFEVRDTLLLLKNAEVAVSPLSMSRADLRAKLDAGCDSELERRFLAFLFDNGYELPTHGQRVVNGLKARPDFTYDHHFALVFVDGPHHDTADRQRLDAEQAARLVNDGFRVIRIDDEPATWPAAVAQHPDVFGRGA